MEDKYKKKKCEEERKKKEEKKKRRKEEKKKGERRKKKDERFSTSEWEWSLSRPESRPDPTRLADPNRFPGRETKYWDS